MKSLNFIELFVKTLRLVIIFLHALWKSWNQILFRDIVGDNVIILRHLFSYECLAGPGERFCFEITSTNVTRLSLPTCILPRGDEAKLNDI